MTAARTDLHLTDDEWAAVSIALRDASGGGGCAAMSPPAAAGPLRRLARLLFGTRRRNPLADPRLEAIRRFSCGRRSGDAAADESADDLAALGFNPAQIDAISLLSR